MPLYKYEWEVTLAGEGSNLDEAWEYAQDCIAADGLGAPDEPVSREMIDPEYAEKAPADETPILKPAHLRKWLIWSVGRAQWHGPEKWGTTPHYHEARRFTLEEAVEICKACGFRRNSMSAKTIKIPNETMVLEEDL